LLPIIISRKKKSVSELNDQPTYELHCGGRMFHMQSYGALI